MVKIYGTTKDKVQGSGSKSYEDVLSKAEPKTVLAVVLLIMVCAAVFTVHWPVLTARAVYFDDDQYFLENHLVQNPSWKSAGRFLSEVLKPSTVPGYYQPLTMISLMLDYAMGGRADNLKPFHLTSLCLHTANTALIIIFLYMLFGTIWPAVIAGLLFGVHPLTVEPISWIGQRKTLLATFFALWCLIIYVRYSRKPDRKLLFGCTATYILALMSKPTTTPLPILLLLLDFWPLRRLNKKTLVEKLPLFVIMIVFSVVTIVSQKRAASVRMPDEYSVVQIPLILCHNTIFYLYKLVWPTKLSAHYPYPKPLSVSNPMILAGVIGTCILIPALVLSLKWTRAILTGWLFFFVAIFPTMGIIGFTIVIASDNYAYLPSVGLLMIVVWLLAQLWSAVYSSKTYCIVTIFTVLLLVASESVATYRYLLRWQTANYFYKYLLNLNPNVSPLHRNYGVCLYKSGQFDQAKEHFARAIQLMPQNFQAYNNMGAVYCLEGKLKEAITCWNRVLELKPDWPTVINNLAWIKATQDAPDLRNPEEAVRLATRACELTEYSQPEYLDTLAAAYAASGKYPQAIETAQKAVLAAERSGDKELASEIRGRLNLYRTGQPYTVKNNSKR